LKSVFDDIARAIVVEPDLSRALRLAEIYGNLLWFADVGVYDAAAVEVDLIARCKAGYVCAPSHASTLSETRILHVITEPFLSGGHTRLMEKLAGMTGGAVDLLITGKASAAAAQRVSNYVEKVFRINASEPVEKVREIADVVAAYQKVVLHIHPDDIYTVAACGVVADKAGLDVYFVNHADHVFSFGCSVADYYFELSSYGKRLDGLKAIKGRKSFLGIPIEIAASVAHRPFMPSLQDSLQFITAGSDIKFKPVKGLSPTHLLDRVLSDYPNSKMLVIGSDIKTAYWWWPLKLKFRSRFSVAKTLPFAEYNEAVKSADFYIDSYPIPGGTAFAEQYIAGRRCIGLVSPQQGYSPADLLKRPSVDEVMDTIAAYQPSPDILAKIIDVHSINSVKARFTACLDKGQTSTNILDTYCGWTGDIGLFRHDGTPAPFDVSVQSFSALKILSPFLAARLYQGLSFSKKVKLRLKQGIARLRRMRGASVGAA
jgi:hypothetical protein